ncbi:oligosaccharide flippase family protein [Sphingomonas colocasiae]|uniref:Oligosaccharide flippase family protein n=1 Tax=Sphingomonas colocasiae TaxID=1848973 RepID=A0ABS7PT86_9SPHN|nr:oligosaccharide flippase family protein [Sphingomonas colocasiae]MBY8823607.1 oligosaccharide flippase family protein [Sphingomonas colocasiae]
MIRNVFMLAGSNVVAQAVTLLAYPVLTHLYLPREFGVFGLITSIAVVMGMVVCARLDTIIQIEGRPAERHLLWLSLAIGFGASGICGVIGYFAISGGLIGIDASGGRAALLAVALALTALLNGLSAVGRQYQVKHGRYKRVAWSQLLRVSAAVAIQVLLGFLVGNYWGLLTGFILGSLLATAMLMPLSTLPAKNHVRSLLLGVRTARKNASLIAIDCLNALISTSTTSLQLIIITALFGPAGAGVFVVATRLIFAPVEAMGGALSSVFFQQLSQGVRDKAPLQPIFLRSLLMAAGLVTLMAIGVAVLLKPFVEIFLSANWVGVVPIGVALIPNLIAKMLVSGVGYTALSLRRPRLITAWNVYQIVSLGMAFSPSLWRNLELNVFVQIYGILLLSGAIFYVVILMIAIRKYDNDQSSLIISHQDLNID